MPLFSTNNPKSTYYDDPNYVTDPSKKMALALTGFKSNGSHNEFGKIMRFLNPLTPAIQDSVARKLTKGTDANQNVRDEQQNDVKIAGNIEAGGAQVLSGVATGNFGQALGGASQVAGTVVGNLNDNAVDFTDDSQQVQYELGGRVRLGVKKPQKKEEPIAMVDKPTGKTIGSMDYGEGIFRKEAYDHMKSIMEDPLRLGQFVSTELKKHEAIDAKNKADGGEIMGDGGKTPIGQIRLKYDGSIEDLNNAKRLLYTSYRRDNNKPSKVNDYIKDLNILDVKDYLEKNKEKLGGWKYDADEFLHEAKGFLTPFENGGTVKKYASGSTVTGNPIEDYFLSLRNSGQGTDPTPDPSLSFLAKVQPGDTAPIPDYGTPMIPTPTLAMDKPAQKQTVASMFPGEYKGTGFEMKTDNQVAGSDVASKMPGFEDIFNAAKVFTGLAGATQKIPQYRRPDAWTSYLQELESRRDQGFTPTETAAAEAGINDQYASDVSNIESLSGGNAATALGNLGAAGARRANSRLKLAALDKAEARNSYDRYADSIFKDLGIDRAIFQEHRDNVIANKEAASGLAAEGLQSVIDSADYKKNYEEGSPYFKYMKYASENEAQLSKLLGSDVMKKFLELYGKV